MGIEKCLMKIKKERDLALEQLEERTIQRDFDREQLKKILFGGKMKVNNDKEPLSDMSFEYSNAIASDKNGLYLQRDTLCTSGSSEKASRKNRMMDTSGTTVSTSIISSDSSSSSNEELKAEDLYPFNNAFSKKDLLCGEKHSLDNNALFSNNTTTTGTNDNNTDENCSSITNPYCASSTNIQSSANDEINSEMFTSITESEKSCINHNNISTAKEEEEVNGDQETNIQKIALDIALLKINDMEKQMKLMVVHNKNLRFRLHALEKNVSYSWREY